MREAIRTDKGPAPKGPYSQAIVASGRQIYVAGQGPLDPDTGEFVGQTFEEQAIRTLENIKAILEAAGASMGDVVKVGAFLSDMSHFATFNEVYRRYFTEPYPARTTVQSDLPGFMIEVDAIAVMPEP